MGKLLRRTAKHGVSLRCGRTEDRLHYGPAGTLLPELVEENKERKEEVVRIFREDEGLRRTRQIQSERGVLDLVRGYFGKGGRA